MLDMKNSSFSYLLPKSGSRSFKDGFFLNLKSPYKSRGFFIFVIFTILGYLFQIQIMNLQIHHREFLKLLDPTMARLKVV